MFGWRPPSAPGDLFGVGFSWAHPSNLAASVVPGLDALRDQYTWEVFYRFTLTPNLALTPDLQLVRNPSLTPESERLWVFGFRSRVSF